METCPVKLNSRGVNQIEVVGERPAHLWDMEGGHKRFILAFRDIDNRDWECTICGEILHLDRISQHYRENHPMYLYIADAGGFMTNLAVVWKDNGLEYYSSSWTIT